MSKLLITFLTSRAAIKAEKRCLSAELKVTVVTVPEEISAECGMALECNVELKDKITQILESNNIEYKIYDRSTKI